MITAVFRFLRLLLVAIGLLAGTVAGAQAPRLVEVADWQVYGADHSYQPDATVPGGGAVRIAPRAEPGEIWSSAAGATVPDAIPAGSRITGYFWARAASPAEITVTIQGGAPDYAALATARIALGRRWKRYAISGVGAAPLPAASQSLTVQLGKISAEVSLGPVAFQFGQPNDVAVDRAFAGFRPAQIVQDVRISSDPGVVLAGVLRLPNRPAGTRHPVVILLGGGGPAPRGIYPLLEKRLLAEGIATLSYDKRGIGQSTGEFVDTNELMERDAVAATAFLRARGEIDGTRLALLGLSQGGVVAPAVAARDHGIAAVVMLAGPVGDKHGPFLDGFRERLAGMGTRKDAIERIVPAVDAFMRAQSPDTAHATLDAARNALVEAFLAENFPRDRAMGMAGFLEHPVLASMYQADPAWALARVRAPVLAVYGGADTIVPSAGNLEAARAVLRDNRDATVVEAPGLEHSFQRVERDASGKPGYAGPPVSDPGVLDLVTGWLAARIGGKRPN